MKKLTPRQQKALELRKDNLTHPQIGKVLGCSASTVASLLAAVRRKGYDTSAPNPVNGPPRKYDYDEILRLRRKGKGPAQIGQELGIRPDDVGGVLYKLQKKGVDLGPGLKNDLGLTKRQIQLIELRNSGMSVGLVAEALGVKTGTVAKALHRLRERGFDVRKGPQPLDKRRGARKVTEHWSGLRLRMPVKTKDGRLGRVARFGDKTVLVQFGTDGPFKRFYPRDLTAMSDESLHNTALEGAG